METVALTVGGQDWGGWTSVAIDAGVEQAARGFTLKLTLRQPNDPYPLALEPEMDVVLKSTGDEMVTGITERVSVHEGKDDSGARFDVEIAGRSKTLRAVKCTAQVRTGNVSKVSPLNLAMQIAHSVGVGTIATVADTGALPRGFRLTPARKAFDEIDAIARDQEWLVTDDAFGYLRICTAGQDDAAPLIYGESDVLDWSYEADSAERYTDYRVIGQRAGTDADFGKAVAGQVAMQTDHGWTVNRYNLTVRAERAADQAQLLRRAKWEAASRAGKSAHLTVKVPGWRQRNGRLWEPNTLARVVYPWVFLDDTWLIAKTDFTRDLQGEFTALTLAHPSAYQPEPVKATKVKAGGKRKGGLLPAEWTDAE